MKTLLLSAPKDKDATSALHKTFNRILERQIGPEYAIYANLAGQIVPGMKVIVFERIDRRQAEDVVASFNPTGHKTGAGVTRYDVSIRDLHEVPYSHPPSVNRCGVGFTGQS